MKKVLIPVDFSESAINAVKYALNLLKQQDGEFEITLLNTYKVYSSTGMFISVEKYMQEDAEREMAGLLDFLKEYVPPHIKLGGRCIRGDVVQTIYRMAEQLEYDLILMGTKGASGALEVFQGSVAGSVMKNAVTPVLVVPDTIAFEPIKKIVFSFDGRKISQEKVVAPILDIAREGDAQVVLLHIADSDEEEVRVDAEKDLFLKDIRVSKVSFPAEDINASINACVHTEKAQLLVMIRRKRGFLENLFHSSATVKEVFDSPVPLLILHD